MIAVTAIWFISLLASGICYWYALTSMQDEHPDYKGDDFMQD